MRPQKRTNRAVQCRLDWGLNQVSTTPAWRFSHKGRIPMGWINASPLYAEACSSADFPATYLRSRILLSCLVLAVTGPLLLTAAPSLSHAQGFKRTPPEI